MNNLQLAVQFFLQIAIILLFCRFVGSIAARLGHLAEAIKPRNPQPATTPITKGLTSDYRCGLVRGRIRFVFLEKAGA